MHTLCMERLIHIHYNTNGCAGYIVGDILLDGHVLSCAILSRYFVFTSHEHCTPIKCTIILWFFKYVLRLVSTVIMPCVVQYHVR